MAPSVHALVHVKGKVTEAVQIGDRDSFVAFAKTVLLWPVRLLGQSWGLRSLVDRISCRF
jgi:hypothetical protein